MTRSYLITGARGVIGIPLINALIDDHSTVIAVSRSDNSSDSPRLKWIKNNLEQGLDISWKQINIYIHCAPLWLLPAALEGCTNSKLRVIAFSSTSVISKQSSADRPDSDLARELEGAEQLSLSVASNLGLEMIILRPTMIYGYGLDSNVMQIASVIKRFNFFLLAGKAIGKRQPVHVDDLVSLIMRLSKKKDWPERIYELGGGEVLSYKEMIIRIFHALGIRPRIISIPVFGYRILITITSLFKPELSPGMADRMNQDLMYNIDKAINQLGFKPAKFLQHPERDLTFVPPQTS